MEHTINFNIRDVIYLIFCTILLSNSIKPTNCECIVARTLAELESLGWSVTGPNVDVFGKPSDWKRALQPLDNFVTGGGIWRITSTSRPTLFSFKIDNDTCSVTSVSVEVKYFSENSVLTVYPCQESPYRLYCYGDPNYSPRIEWATKTFQLNSDALENGEIQLTVNILPGAGGYFQFDSVIIDHDGIPCSSTTTTTTTPEPTTTSEEPTTTEVPSTTTDDWSAETPVDEDTEEPTTVSEDPTTTPTPTTEEPTTPSTSSTTEIIVTEEPISTTEASSEESTTTEDPSTDFTDETTTESSTTEDTTTESSTTEDSTTEITTSEETSTTEITTTEVFTPDSSTPDSSTTDSSTKDSSTTGESSTTEDSTTEMSTSSSTDTSTIPSSTDTPTDTPTTSQIPPELTTTQETTTPIVPVPPPPTSTPSTTTTQDPAIRDGQNSFTPEEIGMYFALPSVLGIFALLIAVCCCASRGLFCWSKSSTAAANDGLLIDGVEQTQNNKNTLANSQYSPNPVSRTNSNVSNFSNSPYPPSPQSNSQFLHVPQRTPVNISAIPRTQPSPGFQGTSLLPGPPQLPPRNPGKSVTLNIPEYNDGFSHSRPGSGRASSTGGSRIMFTGDYSEGDLPRMRRKQD